MKAPIATARPTILLIQAESGLASITGGPEGPARVGVSLVDIGTGLHAYEAILEALITRGRTGQGADIRVSMFDAMMEWMAIPLLFGEYGDAPKRMGLTHFSVAPYGVFQTRDGSPILISVQNDREWNVFCTKVLNRPELATDPRFATNPARIANRRRNRRADRSVLWHAGGGRAVPAARRRADRIRARQRRGGHTAASAPPPRDGGSPNGPIDLPAPPARFKGKKTRDSARCRDLASTRTKCDESSSGSALILAETRRIRAGRLVRARRHRRSARALAPPTIPRKPPADGQEQPSKTLTSGCRSAIWYCE